MNMISDFIDTFIPQNLPKRKRKLLKAEMESHLLDKIDYYREIGYGEEESAQKAISDFGTDEETKNNIFEEFEELYSERSIYGVLAFIGISLMNIICWVSGMFVITADYNRNPDPIGAFISFCMIFAVCIAIIFARVKKYRKMLLSICIACTLVGVCLLVSFLTQFAAYTMLYNLMYIIEFCAPFSISDLIIYGIGSMYAMVLWEALLLIPALYSLVLSVKIKRGTAKDIEEPKKKTVIFSVVFFVFAILNCLLLPTSERYFEHYTGWFDEYHDYISEESENIFEKITIGEPYETTSSMLCSEGYISISEYEKSLDRMTKKQFRNNLKKFDFEDGYEIWFNNEKDIIGNGFIGIKSENGVTTAKGIGNLNKSMYYEGEYDYYNFGYSSANLYLDIFEITDYFKTLKKGDLQSDIMQRFSDERGSIYSKRISVENGIEKSYYRIYFYGKVNPNGKLEYEKNEDLYIELSFENGKLISGAMYGDHYQDGEVCLSTEYIK